MGLQEPGRQTVAGDSVLVLMTLQRTVWRTDGQMDRCGGG